VEVRLGDGLRRNPDVLVVRAAGYDRRVPRLLPRQVILAIEIVSPGLESTDRINKPIEYATAGIEHFWRVEVESAVAVHTFRLGDGKAYVPGGVFRAGDTVTAAGLDWVGIEVDDLIGDD
jgi:Uma2 family endonuclease